MYAIVDAKEGDLYRSDDAGATLQGSPGGDGLADHPTWTSWLNQSIAELYHVAPDYNVLCRVTAAQQDSGAVRVRSRGKFANITMRDWEPLCAGGESGYTAPDPLRPAVVFGGTVEWCNVETGKRRNVTPEVNLPAPARLTWTNPLVFSAANPHALYFGDQFLFKTTNGGESWTRLSDDLTRPSPIDPPNLDEATAKDADARRGKGGVIYSIAPSRLVAPLLWIGTDDGLIKRTPDDGKTWEDVTPRELTPWSKVAMIEASHFDTNGAYAALDRHRLTENGLFADLSG